MTPDPVGAVVHLAAVVGPPAALVAVVARRRPGLRERMAAVLAFALALAGVVVLDAVAARAGWWTFAPGAAGGIGQPMDLVLAWAVLWGPLPTLVRRPSPGVVLTGLAVLDLATMPLLDAVVLGRTWAVGEAVGLALVAAPAMLVGRWTAQRRHLRARVGLQVWMAALVLLGAPLAVDPGRALTGFAAAPWWLRWGGAQLVVIGGVVAAAAVWELLERGQGSPWPWDPPRRLVATGPYRFLRNPMQLGAVLVSVGIFALTRSPAVLVPAVVGVPFSLVLAGGHEDATLAVRAGAAWAPYVASRPAWLPAWRARPVPGAAGPATLWVAATCATCDPVGRWVAARSPVDLVVRPAEAHPGGGLRRAVYEGHDGYRVAGVGAVAHALEHGTADRAVVGFLLRLPVVRALAAAVADAVGFGPRDLPAAPATSEDRAWLTRETE